MEALDRDIAAFGKAYSDIRSVSHPAGMLAALKAYEDIQERLDRIGTDNDLRESISRSARARTAAIDAWRADADLRTGFFEGCIGAIPAAKFREIARAPELGPYVPWLRAVRREYRHMLLPGDEAAYHAAFDGTIGARQLLYRKLAGNMRLRVGGRRMHLHEAEAAAADERRPLAERARIKRTLDRALEKRGASIARIYNEAARDGIKWARKRHYRRPEENDGHGLPLKVADLLTAAVSEAAPPLAERFRLWRGAHGAAEDPAYTWRTARRIALAAARGFSPDFGREMRRMLDGGHIDARPRHGKMEEGFTRPAGPGEPSYIVVNFDRTTEEMVSGLFHEAGHGYHYARYYMRGGGKGGGRPTHLLRRAPRAVEETAAFFMELLGWDEMMRREKDAAGHLALREDRVARLLYSGPGQVARHVFEKEMYARAAQGKAPGRRGLCALWARTQKIERGAGARLSAVERHEWMFDPHFIEYPFQLPAYGFAQVGAAVLYRRYRQACAKGEGARKRWVRRFEEKFLGPGGALTAAQHFRAMGIDVTKKSFYDEGMALIRDELALLEKEKPLPPKYARRAPAL